MKLYDLLIDEKSKLMAEKINKFGGKHIGHVLGRMLTQQYIIEREIDLKISFLEGRFNTLCAERRRLHTGEENTPEDFLLDILSDQISAINEEVESLMCKKRNIMFELINKGEANE